MPYVYRKPKIMKAIQFKKGRTKHPNISCLDGEYLFDLKNGREVKLYNKDWILRDLAARWLIIPDHIFRENYIVADDIDVR